MSKEARQTAILDHLSRHGETDVAALAGQFQVSAMTIRRDLDELATRRQVMRTHGGATPVGRVVFDFQFMERESTRAVEKAVIAAQVAPLVEPGMVILLDSGTTTLAVARAIKAIPDLVVVTSSLPIASELQYVSSLEVLLLGGRLRRESPDLVGPLAEYGLEKIRADMAVLGAEAVDLHGQAYAPTLEIAHLLNAMMAVAPRTYIVADHTKIGRTALARIGTPDSYAGIVTDQKISRAQRRALTGRLLS